MAKKRVKKAVKFRLIFMGTISLICIFYFAVSLVYHTYMLVQLKNQKVKLQNYYIKLQENSEELEDEIKKFQDEKYLAKYARENYLYSTDNEYIIKIKKDIDKDIVVTNKTIKKEYLIIFLSGIIVIVFIYIIKKGVSNKKKKR